MDGCSVHLPEKVRKKQSSSWGRERARLVIFGQERLEHTVMYCLTTGIHSEKYAVRQFYCYGMTVLLKGSQI